MKKVLLLLTSCILLLTSLHAQRKQTFTHADTLRGSITPERAWWDVLRYDITVKPDYESKTIEAKSTITYAVLKTGNSNMQIDLQVPLTIDSVIQNNQSLNFKKTDSNVWMVTVAAKQSKNNSLTIYYHGKPREAIRPPWDGGWIWKKDDLGRPWMSVACQGLGASVWYPCKDIQSDEPDNGATLTITVPDSLIAVGNGRMTDKKNNNDGTTTWVWTVKDP